MRAIAALCLLWLPLFGQTVTSSLTVTATRELALPPDEAVIAVSVESAVTTTRDEVVSALQGSRITVADFTGVSSSSVGGLNPQTRLRWNFSTAIPLAELKAVLAQLAALQKNIEQRLTGASLSFGIQQTQVSAALSQSKPCTTADLLADAKAQAQTMANAAQVTVGPVVAISSPASASSGTCVLTVKFVVYPL